MHDDAILTLPAARRLAIAPFDCGTNAKLMTIDHMKTDGLLDRNRLKRALGDAMHAVLCGAGHNLRIILAHLWVLLRALIGQLMMTLMPITSAPLASVALKAR